MKNKLILSLGTLISMVLIFNLNLVSAGLCLGNDNYYHDCDDDRYFDKPSYETRYYYHGNYYPARDYYYRDYYRPNCCSSGCKKDDGLTYKDNEEYKRTTEYRYEDRGISEKIKKTITEKTEIELNYDIPYVYSYLNYDYLNSNSQDKTKSWYSWMYE